jgi:hypothetical protein
MTTVLATAVASLAGAGGLVLGGAGTASADSAKVLSMTTVGGIAVDGVHQQVFLSDPTSGKIVVTDYAGTVKATLNGLSGVTGLALSADSDRLYAALKGSDQIAAVDTATDTVANEYALPGADAPVSVEVVDGIVWFGYDHDLGSLDVSGDTPVVTLGQGGGDTGFNGAPMLAANPAVPGVLVAGGSGVLAVYHVSAQGAVRQVLGSMDASAKQIALTPDGSTVLTSWGDSGYGYSLGEYSTTDLSKTGNYPITAYPNAVTIAPDGTVAGGSMSGDGPDVHIYHPGGSTPVREYDFPNTGNSSDGDTLVDGILAWAPDESRIFAVSENDNGVLTLRALADPTKELPTLTVSAPAKATRAKSLTVSGRITSPTAIPVGTVLTVTRTDLTYPHGKALPAVTTKAGGAFSFTDAPSTGGTVTYRVSYAGDATHSAVTGAGTVQVSRTTPTLTLNNNGKIYSYGAKTTFTAHLGSTYQNRTVAIWADPYGADKPKKLVTSAKVNSKGNLSVTLTLTRDTAVEAVYAGDAHTAPRTVTSVARDDVKVSTTVAKYYRTGRIGSTKYYYFHKKTSPVFTTTMTYYKGRKQYFEVQVYESGHWYASGAQYFSMSTAGKSAVTLEAPGQSGIRARVRVSYIDTGSGDNVNTTTHGAWAYLDFTS